MSVPEKSDDVYTIEGDDELTDMYSRLRFPKFPPIVQAADELDREDRADHTPTASSQASRGDE